MGLNLGRDVEMGEQLRENPDASTQQLKEKAEEIDPDIAGLSARQFTARYPLQVNPQHEAVPEEADPEPDDEELRSAAREVLLDLTGDLEHRLAASLRHPWTRWLSSDGSRTRRSG